jgi:hypothetical protein
MQAHVSHAREACVANTVALARRGLDLRAIGVQALGRVRVDREGSFEHEGVEIVAVEDEQPDRRAVVGRRRRDGDQVYVERRPVHVVPVRTREYLFL